MIERIHLSFGAFETFLTAAVELSSREITGIHTGALIGTTYLCDRAYPLQTASRKPTEVAYGNGAAMDRARKVARLFAENRYGENSNVGGFHMHPVVRDDDVRAMAYPSISDLSNKGLIAEEILRTNSEYWIEMIIRMQRKNVGHPRERGLKIQTPGKSLIAEVTDTANRHFYRVMVSGFLTKPIRGYTLADIADIAAHGKLMKKERLLKIFSASQVPLRLVQ